MPRVGIALGSNLGNRLANLQAAREALQQHATRGEIFLQAPIYQTEPLHCPKDSPFFYNSVVELSYENSAFELLDITQAIERQLGRAAVPERNAPRIIDIDLLYFGDQVIVTDKLILPHPRLHERRFVLQPLAQIRPELILVSQTLSIAELLTTLISDEPALVKVSESAGPFH